MSGSLRGVWAMVAAIAVMSVLVGNAAVAGTPAVAPGWPVAAPPGGDAFAVPGGPILVANGTPAVDAGGDVAGYARSGRLRWLVARDLVCGNCYGPAVPRLSPTGVLGPIGDFNAGLSAYDPAGGSVPACAGVIADDGDCYGIGLIPGDSTRAEWRLTVARSGHWRLVEDIGNQSYALEQPTFAFAGGVVVVHVPSVDRLLGIERATGRLLWRLPAPHGTLGPIAADDGTVRLAGPGREVVALDPHTGGILWRTALPGVPLAMLPDGSSAEGVVLAVRTGGQRSRRSLVRVDGAGRTHVVAGGLNASAQLRAVGPDGVAYITRADLSRSGVGVLTAIDRRGTVRWRFAQPIGQVGGVGTPAFVGRDVVVTIGQLMYRLRPSRPAVAPPRRLARLDVAPSRFRLAGEVQTCPTANRASCSPSTQLGTVLRLRLSRAAAGSAVRVNLVRVGGTGERVAWSAREFRGRAGAQWMAVDMSGRYLGVHRAAPAPGRYSLVARGGVGAKRWAVSAPVTVVR